MAHYAFLDDNNIVTDVITGIDETELIEGIDPETWYGNFRGQVCKRTSYSGKIRKRYAGIGFSYDPELDAFLPLKPSDNWVLNTETLDWEPPSKPFDSWVINEDTLTWQAPVPFPSDGGSYEWSEETKTWVELES
jgi:hypothetical protein